MRFFKPWLPVICWMVVIFLASTDMGSAEHTSRIVEPLLRWLRPGISQDGINRVHFLIRKTAHLTEYSILAVLLCRAVEQSRRNFGHWKSVLVALGVATLYAASDEFHQSFVSSRTASVRDVMIDSCGAMIGLFIFWVIHSAASALRGGTLRPPGNQPESSL